MLIFLRKELWNVGILLHHTEPIKIILCLPLAEGLEYELIAGAIEIVLWLGVVVEEPSIITFHISIVVYYNSYIL